jgi:zinc D-Ala-D-Ala carboxypeptidase
MSLKHFSLEEFACTHCQKNDINHDLVELLDLARDMAGVPFRINSGFRCEHHNKAVGGSPNSLHKLGRAADIHVPDNAVRYQILKSLFAVEMPRVLIYKTFIHADIAGEGKQGEIALWMG